MFSRFLSRDDIFISYSRRDGAAYAAGLADELTARKFSCFIDKLGTEPDRDLPASLKRTIRNCTLLVVVGTDGAAASEFVAKEIDEFKKTRRTIVPVDFGGAVGRARWYGLIPGLAAEPEENPEARRAGDPSPNVVGRIEKSFNYTRRNQRMRRLLVGALALFILLMAASGVAAYAAALNLREARRQSRAAEEATASAREQTRAAAEAAAHAEAQTRRANEATQRAEDASRQAAAAEQERRLALTKTEAAEKKTEAAEKKTAAALTKTAAAERKTIEAERRSAEAATLEREARARADEQQKRADEQQARAEQQLRRSRNLLYASEMAVAQQSFEAGRFEYGRRLLDSYCCDLSYRANEAVAADDRRGFEWRYLWRIYHKRYEPDPEYLRPTAAAFSPDGRWLASAGTRTGLELWDTSAYRRTDGVVSLMEARRAPGRQDWREQLKVAVSALAFAPDSKMLAAGTSDGKLQLFEMAFEGGRSSDPADPAGRRRRSLRFTGRPLPQEFTPRAAPVTSLAFSPDGKMLAAGFESGPPLFYDVAARRQLETPAAPAADASVLAYSPDGRWLAFGGGGRVGLWETAGGRAPLALDWGASAVAALTFSPDSRLLAATAGDGKVKVWEVASRRQVEAAVPLEGQAEALAFSPDGRLVATVAPGGAAPKLWDAATFEEVETLAYGDDDQRSKRRRGRQQDFPPHLRGYRLAFAPDSVSLAAWTASEALALWDTSPNPLTLDAGDADADATYSPDGKVLVTGGEDGTLSVWNPLKRELVHRVELLQFEDTPTVGDEPRLIFSFSPDGKTLAATSGDGWSVTLLETGSYTELLNFKVGEPSDESTSGITALDFSPDGSRLAVSVGQITNLYDAAKLRGPSPPVPLARLKDTTAEEITSEVDHGDVRSLVFLQGGQVLATASTYTVRLWDLKAHSLLRRFPFSWTHEGPLGKLAVSPDGRQLAVSTEYWLRLYDVRGMLAGDADEVLDLRTDGKVAGRVAFSPDGKTLASGMGDGTVRLWNTVAGQELITLGGHRGRVEGVAFSPGGHALATTGGGTLSLWLAATEQEVRKQPTPTAPGE